MIRDGWYCCSVCGCALFPVREDAVVHGAVITSTKNIVRKIWITEPEIHNRYALQYFLEDAHTAMNEGECKSYNICDFCVEPNIFPRESTTPCADAFLQMHLKTQKTLIRLKEKKRRPKKKKQLP